jgi:hypothetical protein
LGISKVLNHAYTLEVVILQGYTNVAYVGHEDFRKSAYGYLMTGKQCHGNQDCRNAFHCQQQMMIWVREVDVQPSHPGSTPEGRGFKKVVGASLPAFLKKTHVLSI